MITSALLASLALAAPQEPAGGLPAVILPDGPEGWRYERIDFPLSFAPELGKRGFEELRFAPGMYDPNADDYFTYAFGIRLGDPRARIRIDDAFLESTLLSYYTGLCRAVGESRGLELDLSKIAARVEYTGRDWTATVDMYDAFVTGKPLKLSFELSAQQGYRATELLGLASPQPADHAVWKELRGIRDRWRSELDLSVFLNHLFVVPDQETYDAIAKSEFLRETFAVSEERTTVRKDSSYTGVYFYGDHTYFEFLPPLGVGEMVLGASGLAFGIEEEGGTARVIETLEGAGVRSFAGPITREVGGEHVPWFQIMGIEKPTTTSRLSLFSLEYDPAFLPGWYADLAPAYGGITRRSTLERYKAKLGAKEKRPFVDVTRVHVLADPAERARLVEACRAFGYAVAEPREEGDKDWNISGPGYTITVHPSSGPGRVSSFHVALREPISRPPLQLGKAVVRFHGDTAAFELE